MLSRAPLGLCAAVLIASASSAGCSNDEPAGAADAPLAETPSAEAEGSEPGASGASTGGAAGGGSYSVPGAPGGSAGAGEGGEAAGSPPAGSPSAGSPPAGPPAGMPPAPAPKSCADGATVENDDNGTPEKATELPGGSGAFCGSITPGDADHFSFVLPPDAKSLGWKARWTEDAGATMTITSEGVTRKAGDEIPFYPGKRYVVALTGAKTAAEYTITITVDR